MNLFNGRLVHQAADSQVAVITDSNTPIVARHTVCEGCPWRKSNAGKFPPEAFVVSRVTCKPEATDMFMCHEAGWEKPVVCAGFLITNNEHRAVKILADAGIYDIRQVLGLPEPMFCSYAEMEKANGG